MDWNDLRYFLAVHRTRTLSGAARELGCEHSTVGRRLAALEDALGAKLFTRTPDGLSPTAAAASVVAFAEDMQRAAEAIERRVLGDDARVEGTVRVTTSESFSGFLVQRLAGLRARHPALLVEILSGNQSLDLTRGEADLAVRLSRTTQPDLLARRIGDNGWSLYAAEAYLARAGTPETPEDLAGHDVVGFDETMSGIPGARWLEDHGQGARVVMRGNSIVSVFNATLVGMGLSVLPCFLPTPSPPCAA